MKTKNSVQTQSSSNVLPIICGVLVSIAMFGFFAFSEKKGPFQKQEPMHLAQQEMKQETPEVAFQPETLPAPEVKEEMPTPDPIPTPQPEIPPAPPAPVMLQKPYSYADTASYGVFTQAGQDTEKTIFSYKIKQFGDKNLLFKRFKETKKDAVIEKFKVLNDTSEELPGDAKYVADQILYVEYMEGKAQEVNANANEAPKVKQFAPIDVNTAATACVTYKKFFECTLSSTVNIDEKMMKNAWYGFLHEIKELSTTDQNAKCSSTIEQIKLKSASNLKEECKALLN